MGEGTEGPIPWTAMHYWASVHEVSAEQADDLFFHITAMDTVYLKFRAKKIADANKAPPKGGKSK